VGKVELWKRQFNQHPDGDNFYSASLRWPHEKQSAKPPQPWHEKLDRFSCLATDLGQRDAGAFALMEARANDDFSGKPTRFIGETEGKRWRARLVASGMFRLSGEDRREWRESKRHAGDFNWREELWGERGRAATPDEIVECAELMGKFGCDEKDLLPPSWQTALSFPEQNDKLLVAARRAQSRLARLHRWCWFLTDPKQAGKVAATFAEIADPCDERTLPAATKALAFPEMKTELLAALHHELAAWTAKLPELLVRLANRCVPLRGRSWRWHAHPDAHAQKCFVLSQSGAPRPNAKHRLSDGTEGDVTWIRGQRGLSFERIEQIEELRKRFQSLNQTLRRTPGGPPPKRRDESIPDPCPDLLTKLDRTKEQRVNQTAHMILAEALGLRLAPPPASKATLRASRDQHGVYQRVRAPVDFVIIEDLSRYRASQGRAPRENSRLMKWSHRAVREKLKQLCEVFGLPVLETPAAYSSRFCSRSGVPGFRAEQVVAGFTQGGHWAWLAGKKDERGNPTQAAQHLRDLDMMLGLAQLELESEWKRQARVQPCPQRSLLVPLSSGPIFVPVSEHSTADGLSPAVAQADVNAAINLALRAIADPRQWSIHPRLRTQREGDVKPGKSRKGKTTPAISASTTPRLLTREKRKYGETGNPLVVERPANARPDDARQPNFFADFAGLKEFAHQLSLGSLDCRWLQEEWTSATISGQEETFRLVHAKSFWGCVRAAEWKRVNDLNSAHLANWRRKLAAATANPPVPGHPEL
ncbi:MAG: type V CRISPR-associated protein Cas12b, partial [Opitutaceae bacterium]